MMSHGAFCQKNRIVFPVWLHYLERKVFFFKFHNNIASTKEEGYENREVSKRDTFLPRSRELIHIHKLVEDFTKVNLI